jgi:hypothetical protein
MKVLALTVGILLVAGYALAADIDGKWTGQMAGGMGGDPMTLSYTFKASGSTLAGTSLGPDGKEIPIKNGKIEGNNISFQVAVDFGGNEMKFDYKGVLSGDQIKLTFSMGGGPGGGPGGDMGGGMPPMEILLKKAK